MANPKIVGDHLEAVISGWEDHAADASFSGLTLAQFKTKVKPSLDTRAVIEDLDLQRDGARVDRENADVTSEEIAANVVNSVKGDTNFGENSALYASFGYIRKDDRKSGLTRVPSNVIAAPVAFKVAA